MKLRERILPCRYCGIVPDIWKTLCCILLPGTIQLLDSELQSIIVYTQLVFCEPVVGPALGAQTI